MLLWADHYKTLYSFMMNEPYRENAITDTEKAPKWQLDHFLSDMNNKQVH